MIQRAIDSRKEEIARYTEIKKRMKKEGADEKAIAEIDDSVKGLRSQIKKLEKNLN